jgi:hypothetical protein
MTKIVVVPIGEPWPKPKRGIEYHYAPSEPLPEVRQPTLVLPKRGTRLHLPWSRARMVRGKAFDYRTGKWSSMATCKRFAIR